MPTTSIKLILLAVFFLAANAASATDEEPQWRRGYDNQWCIQLDWKEACLPVGAELTRFEEHHAWWHVWEERGFAILIKYDVEVPSYDKSVLSSQCLEIRSSFGSRDVLVTELVSESDDEDSSSVGIYVAVFDERFAITLTGTNHARMHDIVTSLMEQWSPSANDWS